MTSVAHVDSDDDTEAFPDGSRPAANDEPGTARVWVLTRKRADGAVDSLRSFDDEARARADLELVQSVSDDEFWIAAVPLIETQQPSAAPSLSRVQALVLSWLADGAEVEGAAQLDETVQVRPQHVRGFLSVPPEEWRRMEEKGWVRNGMLTPEGAERIGRGRRAAR